MKYLQSVNCGVSVWRIVELTLRYFITLSHTDNYFSSLRRHFVNFKAMKEIKLLYTKENWRENIIAAQSTMRYANKSYKNELIIEYLCDRIEICIFALIQ